MNAQELCLAMERISRTFFVRVLYNTLRFCCGRTMQGMSGAGAWRLCTEISDTTEPLFVML